MKLSKLWLQDWVPFSLTGQELAHQLTMAGLEVDAVSPVAGDFNQVIVAEVLATQPHPNADKLTLCEVNINGKSFLQIVCGASNVRPGIKVALAMIGAQLPGGFKIKESKLRGELSQGMLCSVSELGMAEHSEGIIELDNDAPVGQDLREYLCLNDEVIDVDLTPNRADCFSVLGVAREIAALNKLTLQEKPILPVLPSIDDQLPIHISNPQACPRYCGRIIRDLNQNAHTPLWMRERLRRAGLRVVHPVVDVMNYVMIELGQPLHAFDLERIEGDIHVRFSQTEEEFTLLDGKNIRLDDKVLVIADDQKALALAGIMGGENSAVQANTQSIFLESAFFNPLVIAGVARKFALFSDASQRFERGVDPNLAVKALERATALILDITGGQAGPLVEVNETAHLPSSAQLVFNMERVKKLTGLTISPQEIKRLLTSLGIQIISEQDKSLKVAIPSYRFDLQYEVDLVEEIIRLHGYDHLQAEPMHASVQTGSMCFNETISAQLAHWFSHKGYHETISYSFVDPELQEALYPHQEVLQLLNPISSELSQMRLGLWPGLLASLIYNVHRQQQVIQLFEIGVVFDVEKQSLTERPCIAGLLMGTKGTLHWAETKHSFDFFDLKGDLQSLFSFLQLKNVEFIATSHDALHPGQSAAIQVDGIFAGWIGVLHPRLADALDIQHEVILFELNLAALKNDQAPQYKKISKYPQIRRDLSFLVAHDVSAMQIELAVKEVIQENWLVGLDIFDVYRGEGVPQGKKSLAIAFTLQDDTRTLVDAEINSLISAIINTLESKFSIVLRE